MFTIRIAFDVIIGHSFHVAPTKMHARNAQTSGAESLRAHTPLR